ncbi:hypothetical protein HDU67_008987 [Dinochytrium kinnereticum]|nr:hypothetical protein HDU67_008987 [Dinochytrium kinnereticum]
MLENATLDVFEPIASWDWERAVDRRRPLQELVGIIEEAAEKVVMELISGLGYEDKPSEHLGDILEGLKRVACYTAADGANSIVGLSRRPLLHRVDSQTYFGNEIPSILPPSLKGKPRNGAEKAGSIADKLPKLTTKREYKIAYLISADNDEGLLPNMKHLIDELDDGSAIILIHVDVEATQFHTQLQNFIQQREQLIPRNPSKPIEPGNVFLATSRFKITPPDAPNEGVLWSFLAGMWELLDMAVWENFVNLSPMDMPMRTSREVHRVLALEENAGKSFLAIEDGAEASGKNNPRLQLDDGRPLAEP